MFSGQISYQTYGVHKRLKRMATIFFCFENPILEAALLPPILRVITCCPHLPAECCVTCGCLMKHLAKPPVRGRNKCGLTIPKPMKAKLKLSSQPAMSIIIYKRMMKQYDRNHRIRRRTSGCPQKALRGGIPRSFLEPLGRSWSRFVGMYRQKLTRSLKN